MKGFPFALVDLQKLTMCCHLFGT